MLPGYYTGRMVRFVPSTSEVREDMVSRLTGRREEGITLSY